MLAVAILKQAGFDVTAVDNGRLLVEALRTWPGDLVLMDIHMPEMDGLQATAAIRALPGNAGAIPIITMTAYAVEADRESCLAAGMNDYVSKPIDKRELLTTIDRWLNRAAGAEPPRHQEHVPPDGVINLRTLAQLEEDCGAEVVRKLVKSFVAETAARLERIVKAVSEADMTTLEREALALKASSGSFGAVQLYDYSEAIELTALAGDLQRVGAIVRGLPKASFSACQALAQRYM